MVEDWLPTAFKIAAAVGVGLIIYHFLPNTVGNAVTTTVSNFLGQLP